MALIPVELVGLVPNLNLEEPVIAGVRYRRSGERGRFFAINSLPRAICLCEMATLNSIPSASLGWAKWQLAAEGKNGAEIGRQSTTSRSTDNSTRRCDLRT